MSDYSGKLHLENLQKEQSRDAYQWSRATVGSFYQVFGVIIDQEYMHTIMATAMMSMRDSIINGEVKTLEDKVKKLKSLILLTDKVVENVVMNEVAQAQYLEFIRCYPDEHPEENKQYSKYEK